MDYLYTSIQEFEKKYGGRVGLYATNIQSGQTLSYNENQQFGTGSVIKFPLLYYYYMQCQQGVYDPQEIISMKEDYMFDIPDEAGVLKKFSYGMRFPVDIAASLMIGISDNAATNVFLVDYTPKQETNDFLHAQGFSETKVLVDKLTLDFFENSTHDIGVSTPYELTYLLKDLFTNITLSKVYAEKILSFMELEYRSHRLTRNIPHQYAVGNNSLVKRYGSKGGTYPKHTVIADAAFIENKNNDVILIACQMEGFVNEHGILPQTDDFYCEVMFGEIGKMCYEQLS